MKIIVAAFTVLILVAEGCFLMDGSLYRSNLKVTLATDRPAYYNRGKDGEPGDKIGTLEKRVGDTVATIGIYRGGIWSAHYLMLVDGKEVYILRSNVMTPDDQLYLGLRSKFKLKLSEDRAAWSRALNYVEDHSTGPVEIATENLIKTKSGSDTATTSYLLTRVVQRPQVEYEIICQSKVQGFDLNKEATQLAFYMVTGRIYSSDN